MRDPIVEFLLEYHYKRQVGKLEGWHLTTMARLTNEGKI